MLSTFTLLCNISFMNTYMLEDMICNGGENTV